MVTIHRNNRKTEIFLGGSHETLDLRSAGLCGTPGLTGRAAIDGMALTPQTSTLCQESRGLMTPCLSLRPSTEAARNVVLSALIPGCGEHLGCRIKFD